jgi:CrcB protein
LTGPAWDGPRATAVAVGGALGASVRWAVTASFAVHGFPWPVFVLNVGGSLLLGVLLAEEWTHPRHRLLLHDLGGIGFCGGLTTFSTFAVEVVDLTRDGDGGVAAVYALASVATAIAGVIVGASARRHVRAIAQPLEGAP